MSNCMSHAYASACKARTCSLPSFLLVKRHVATTTVGPDASLVQYQENASRSRRKVGSTSRQTSAVD